MAVIVQQWGTGEHDEKRAHMISFCIGWAIIVSSNKEGTESKRAVYSFPGT